VGQHECAGGPLRRVEGERPPGKRLGLVRQAEVKIGVARYKEGRDVQAVVAEHACQHGNRFIVLAEIEVAERLLHVCEYMRGILLRGTSEGLHGEGVFSLSTVHKTEQSQAVGGAVLGEALGIDRCGISPGDGVPKQQPPSDVGLYEFVEHEPVSRSGGDGAMQKGEGAVGVSFEPRRLERLCGMDPFEYRRRVGDCIGLGVEWNGKRRDGEDESRDFEEPVSHGTIFGSEKEDARCLALGPSTTLT